MIRAYKKDEQSVHANCLAAGCNTNGYDGPPVLNGEGGWPVLVKQEQRFGRIGGVDKIADIGGPVKTLLPLAHQLAQCLAGKRGDQVTHLPDGWYNTISRDNFFHLDVEGARRQ